MANNQNKSKNIVIIVTSIIVIVAIYIFYSPVLSFINDQMSFKLSGNLYVTVVDESGKRLDAEILSLKNKILKPIVINNNRNMTPALYKDNGSVVFSSRPINSKASPQLFLMNNKNNIKQITKNNTYLKTYPRFSADGKSVVYMALSNLKGDYTIPENWSIYEVNISSGKERFITNGEYPVFSKDGKSIVVLKNKGLYLVNMLNRSSKKVWGISNGSAVSRMMFAVSNDKSKLAWVDPYNKRVYVYSIRSWSPFVMGMKVEISETALHPVFSPNGNFLALEEIGLDVKNSLIKKASIVVYDLSSSELQKKDVFTFPNTYLQSVSITDWQ